MYDAEYLGRFGLQNLPSHWSIESIGNLLSEDRGISVGVMYPGDHDPNGIPLIRAGDLMGSIINPNPDFYITPEKHHEYRRTALEGGELLVSLVGEVGNCAVVPPSMAGWNAARAIAVLRLRDSIEAEYLRIVLLSKPLQQMMLAWSNTTVQTTLNLKEIKELPIPVPPSEERRNIIEIGSAFDIKIEANRRMNETLEATARALFKSWFVDFDPVHQKSRGEQPVGMDAATADLFPDSFEDRALGLTPAGWEVVTLGNVIDVIHGYAFKGEFFRHEPPGDVLLTPGNFAIGGGFKSDKLKYYDGEVPEDYVLQENDLIITMTDLSKSADTLGYPALVPKPIDGRFLHNQRLGKVLIFDEARISKIFLYLLLCTRQYRYEILATASGSTVKHTAPNRIMSFRFPLPSSEIMTAFTEISDFMYESILLNEEGNRTLAGTRDALLPKLVSGEIRVGDVS